MKEMKLFQQGKLDIWMNLIRKVLGRKKPFIVYLKRKNWSHCCCCLRKNYGNVIYVEDFEIKSKISFYLSMKNEAAALYVDERKARSEFAWKPIELAQNIYWVWHLFSFLLASQLHDSGNIIAAVRCSLLSYFCVFSIASILMYLIWEVMEVCRCGCAQM